MKNAKTTKRSGKKTITQKEFNEIAELHRKWLAGDCNGERAYISRCRLSNIRAENLNLTNAVFYDVTFKNVDFYNVNFTGVTFGDPNKSAKTRSVLFADVKFCGCLMTGAKFNRIIFNHVTFNQSNLKNAYFCQCSLNFECEFVYCYLRFAEFYYGSRVDATVKNCDTFGIGIAYIDKASRILKDDTVIPSIVPEEGSFVGWKKCFLDDDDISTVCIVKLLIPEDAKRSSGTGRKCRCSKAKVLAIETLGGKDLDKKAIAHSIHDFYFKYKAGKTVVPDSFNKNRFDECSNGIHFFMTRQEAVDYSS